MGNQSNRAREPISFASSLPYNTVYLLRISQQWWAHYYSVLRVALPIGTNCKSSTWYRRTLGFFALHFHSSGDSNAEFFVLQQTRTQRTVTRRFKAETHERERERAEKASHCLRLARRPPDRWLRGLTLIKACARKLSESDNRAIGSANAVPAARVACARPPADEPTC